MNNLQLFLKSQILTGPEAGDAVVEGVIPPWLSGTLMRTGLGLLSAGGWHAEHLFDALGMIYSFNIQASGVRWQQRLLDCVTNREALQGHASRLSFGTPATRSLFERIVRPIADSTDNANVNVQKIGPDWVAMTETPHQLKIDPNTLKVLETLRYSDDLPPRMNMSAHPQFDFSTRELISVGIHFGAKSEVIVYSQPVMMRNRKILARLPMRRVPYIHSFGVTTTKVILICHPFDINPVSVAWSNKGLIDHFKWNAAQGTKLIVVDRATGATRTHECDSFFAFHVANAFDDGADVVMDLMTYDDAAIAQSLTKMESLMSGFPDLAPKLTRLRLAAGMPTAKMERFGPDAEYEFPMIHYRQKSGIQHRYIWGACGRNRGSSYDVSIVKTDMQSGQVGRYSDGCLYGEPVFVGRPQGVGEDDGVLLTVGMDLSTETSHLCILNAASLQPLAKARAAVPLPFGFHGGFSFES